MANQPFDQTIINALERPTSSDLNQAQGQAHADVRLLASKLFQAEGATAGQEGFVGDSFKVVPISPASMNVQITNGIGFQNGSSEINIGGILGLIDAYPYKALTMGSDRIVPVVASPTTAGVKRYDLIQVRAPTGTERLTNSQSKDIYNPTLNTFNATNVYKTLSSDLTDSAVQYIAHTETGTAPIVYKTGPLYTGSVEYPTVDSGYLPLAYIYRENGQSSIVQANVTDKRSTIGCVPNYGYALKPNLQSINSTNWTYVDGLNIDSIYLRDGLARIRLQPLSNASTNMRLNASTSDPGDFAYISIKVEGPTPREFLFYVDFPTGVYSTSIPLPTVEHYFSAGLYSISVLARCNSLNTGVNFRNLVLFAAQG